MNLEKFKYDDIDKYRKVIEYYLLLINPSGGSISELVQKYTKWGNMSLIPIEQLEGVAKDLMAESNAKKEMSHEDYNKTVSAKSKIEVYKKAVELLPAMLESEGIELDSCVSFAGFRRVLSDCVICAVQMPIEADKPEKQDKPQKNKKKFVPPTIKEIEAYLKSKKITNVNVNAFFAYYETANWHLSSGKKMKNWQQSVGSWHFGNEDRDQKQKLSGTVGYGYNVQPLRSSESKAGKGDVLQEMAYKPIFSGA